MKYILSIFIIIAVISIFRSDNAQAAEPISEQQARQIATDYANNFLKDKTFVDAGNTVHRYETITADTWRVVEQRGNRWVLKINPPDTIYITVSLAIDGTDAKMEQYGFSPL